MNKIKDLSEIQEKILLEIRNKILFAKQFDNHKDYWIASEMKYINENRYDYEDVLKYKNKIYDEWNIEKDYKKYWLDELNNITLTRCSSNTIRALEKKGYIKIIEDGFGCPDRVELLEKGLNY